MCVFSEDENAQQVTCSLSLYCIIHSELSKKGFFLVFNKSRRERMTRKLIFFTKTWPMQLSCNKCSAPITLHNVLHICSTNKGNNACWSASISLEVLLFFLLRKSNPMDSTWTRALVKGVKKEGEKPLNCVSLWQGGWGKEIKYFFPYTTHCLFNSTQIEQQWFGKKLKSWLRDSLPHDRYSVMLRLPSPDRIW